MKSTPKVNPLVQTDEINAILEERGLKHCWVAEQVGLESHVFSLAKSGYRYFPRECVGKFAEAVGISPDYARELWGLEEEKTYSDIHR